MSTLPRVDGSRVRWARLGKINNPESGAIGLYPVVSTSGRQTGTIPPRTTWTLTSVPDAVFGIGNGAADDISGRIAYVDRTSADQLVYMDRPYDVTHSPAYAVDIRVVREENLSSTRITLANVPLDPRYGQRDPTCSGDRTALESPGRCQTRNRGTPPCANGSCKKLNAATELVASFSKGAKIVHAAWVERWPDLDVSGPRMAKPVRGSSRE